MLPFPPQTPVPTWTVVAPHVEMPLRPAAPMQEPTPSQAFRTSSSTPSLQPRKLIVARKEKLAAPDASESSDEDEDVVAFDDLTYEDARAGGSQAILVSRLLVYKKPSDQATSALKQIAEQPRYALEHAAMPSESPASVGWVTLLEKFGQTSLEDAESEGAVSTLPSD